MSQLIYKVLGPVRRDRVGWVLDYHGLHGDAAVDMSETARRCRTTAGIITVYAAKVRAAGAALPLRNAIVVAAMRVTRPGEDHLARTRIARTLGLPAPTPTPTPSQTSGLTPRADLATARAATRILAAVGPLDMATLLGALARSRRWKDRNNPATRALAAALTAVGANQDTTRRWQAPTESPVPDRYRAIVTAGADRDLTRRDMIDILTAAGYAPNSAAGLLSAVHPLFTHTGRDRYRVLGTAADRHC